MHPKYRMAIVLVEELHDNCDGECDEKLMRTYHRVFRVVSDDPVNDRQPVVMTATGIPPMYDPMPGDTLFVVTNIRAQGVHGDQDAKEWEVTCTYSYLDTPGNPFTRAPTIAWTSDKEPYPLDFDVQGKAIVNKAQDPLDPSVMREVVFPVLHYTRNEPTYLPALATAYMNTVNSDLFYGCPAKSVKCTDISAQSQQEMDAFNGTPNIINYYAVTYEFKFSVLPKGFRVYLLNQGLRQIVNGKKMAIYEGGSPVTSPVLLDADGKVLDNNGTPVWLDFDIFNEVDYNSLGIALF